LLIFNILSGDGPLTDKMIVLAMFLAAILLAIVIHEMCHGFAAYALGDPTAKNMGRLTFNPIRHIDPVGGLMMLVAGFGWAKPVLVDTRYFEKPKRDMALVSLAGPASNFLLAFIAVGCIRLAVNGSVSNIHVYLFLELLALLNIGLGMFNLIPIPPLDGSKILGAFLSDRAYYSLMRFERYGMMALMALILLGNFSGGRFSVFGFLREARNFLYDWMLGVFRFS
jgi:Zn-dependent protease